MSIEFVNESNRDKAREQAKVLADTVEVSGSCSPGTGVYIRGAPVLWFGPIDPDPSDYAPERLLSDHRAAGIAADLIRAADDMTADAPGARERYIEHRRRLIAISMSEEDAREYAQEIEAMNRELSPSTGAE